MAQQGPKVDAWQTKPRSLVARWCHKDAYRRQSVAACDGGGRVGHAVRLRGRGAGRAWRAPARHCGAGVRGARCTPLTRAPPAPATVARANPHRTDRPHRAFEASASGLQPRALPPHHTLSRSKHNTSSQSIPNFD